MLECFQNKDPTKQRGPDECQNEHVSQVLWAKDQPNHRFVVALNEPGSKLLVLGMVIQPLMGNPYNGYINPYYWVDDHPPLYGNNGSLDPSTNGSLETEHPLHTPYTNNPYRDPITETENGFMEPKYLAFRK